MSITPEDMNTILAMNPGMSKVDVEQAMELDLDQCVLNALELFEEQGVPILSIDEFERPLVVGSGNAIVAGRAMFGAKAVFADESTYRQVFESNQESVDGVYVLTASGAKDGPILTNYFSREKGVATRLLTCTPDSDAHKALSEQDQEHTTVTPKTQELYTYNTSTYMGWLFACTGESPRDVRWWIENRIAGTVPDTSGMDSLLFIVDPRFDAIRDMYSTKFDELFQPHVSGQVFTPGQTAHAKTINPSATQLVVGLSVENEVFGVNRYNVPMPHRVNYEVDMGYGGMMAAGYFVIGQIQRQHPPYFKDNIVNFCLREFPQSFGKPMSPITR